MPTMHSSTASRARLPCAYCVVRHTGLCDSIDDHDQDAVSALEASRSPVRVFDVGEVLYSQGDPNEYVFNLISGWVALHRDLPDGRRQITRFLLPGGLFGLEPAGAELGHTATAVTMVTACPIARKKFDDLRQQVPSLNEAFISLLERDNHHGFETLTVLGQGTAKERIGALISELVVALGGQRAITPGTVVRIPLTQRQIAEATGLTSIHVNRVLRQLREDGVIEFHNGALVVTNPRKLQELTEPGLDRPHRSPDEVDDSRFRSTLDVAPSDAATPARRTF
jgi:CRP/FNR family transcriptional regulator, anaerobic regulatory protein